MKEITIKLYSYDELSEKAQAKALSDWNEYNEYNDDPMMQSHMINLLKEELDERGIKYDEDSIDVRYSLAHCQGDGFMFEGRLEWRGRTLQIKHSGHYYHMYSRTIEVSEGDELSDDEMGQFVAVYEAVCKLMERAGYDQIEWTQSAENFSEACEANEYTFEENGTMRNV